MTYKVGDVVTLQSGGISMTVIDVHTDGFISVTWITNEQEVRRATFPSEALKGVTL